MHSTDTRYTGLEVDLVLTRPHYRCSTNTRSPPLVHHQWRDHSPLTSAHFLSAALPVLLIYSSCIDDLIRAMPIGSREGDMPIAAT